MPYFKKSDGTVSWFDGADVAKWAVSSDYTAITEEEAAQLLAPTLSDAKKAKYAEINAGFDSALAASLTMPSINTPPSAVEVAVGAAALAVVDVDGPAFIMQTHSDRRAKLTMAVNTATTVESVQAVVVSYAV